MFKINKKELHPYLECHSSTGVFQTFCLQKPTTFFFRKWNIGRKWVNAFFFLLNSLFTQALWEFKHGQGLECIKIIQIYSYN